MLSKIELFEPGTDGYSNYRIPSLLVTPSGSVLAAAEARTGGDWGDNDIVLRRSEDGGRTWGPNRIILRHDDYGPGPVSNFVMIGDRDDGTILFLYCHNYTSVFYMRSDDDGRTFSRPVDITGQLEGFRSLYPWRVIATGPGHGTQLRNGRMIVPLWMSDGSSTEFGAGNPGHRPSAVSLIYSDDCGRTWQCGGIVCRHGECGVDNPSETVMVELVGGGVLFNIRSESPQHRRLVSTSPDGVSGWTEPRFEEALLEPVCMAALIRHSWPVGDRPGRILFSNPDNIENEFVNWEPSRDRKRLTVKMSYDDCGTWPVSRVLEEGPSGYSDLAVLPNGEVLCLFEQGSPGDGSVTWGIVLARFDLDWLRSG